MAGPDLDAVIVGDGPAGLALAAACGVAGAAVVVVGRDQPWTATYGTWRDDVPDVPDALFASLTDRAVVVGERRHELLRPYGVLDGERTRAWLARDVPVMCATATGAQHFGWGSRVSSDAGAVDARLVVDATGSGALLRGAPLRRPRAWQTAYGVVVDDVDGLAGVEPDVVTLMDWRQPDGAAPLLGGVPTFCYVVPVAGGWLVEETVLAADAPVDPQVLRSRLAARTGMTESALDCARFVEHVRIPMGVPLPWRPDPVVAFGAAAGYVHPATGYSIAASLRAAPRVARAIADQRTAVHVHDAVWPRAHRRARALHDYGLAALGRLDAADTRAFFDAFFELPVDLWSEYLRVDASPWRVATVMRRVFSAAPARVRRRLLAGNPRAFVRLLRP